MRKRFLALLLAILMCAGLLPSAAYAADAVIPEEELAVEEPVAEPDAGSPASDYSVIPDAPVDEPDSAQSPTAPDEVPEQDAQENIDADANVFTEENFPDEAFRNAIVECIGEGPFTAAQLAAVKALDMPCYGITNLKGIEFFTGLETLGAIANSLSSVDLSKNTALVYLDMTENNLTALDVSTNTALEYLNVSENMLTALDVSANTALYYLKINHNQIASLDLSKNTALKDLYAKYNRLAGELDLSHNSNLTTVNLSNNRLTKIDFSGCTKITECNLDSQYLPNTTFQGWFTDAGYTNAWDGTVNAETVLYAYHYRPRTPLSDCTLTLEFTSTEYTGYERKPYLTVVNSSGNTIAANNYQISYSNNINPGTATVLVSATEIGSCSGSVTLTFDILPCSPYIETSNTKTGIKLEWNRIEKATGYEIYRSKGTGTFSLVKTCTSGLTESWTDTNVTQGTEYRYRIKTVSRVGGTDYKSRFSNTVIFMRLEMPKITSVTNTASGIKLTWEKVAGAEAYVISRSKGTDIFRSINDIYTVSTTSFTDTGATAGGTRYRYKISAMSGQCWSALSEAETIYRLAQPKIESLENTSTGIKVTWGKVKGATGYKLYRSIGTDSYKLIKTCTSGDTTSCTTTVSMTNGTRYRFKIVAIMTVGDKDYTSAESAVKTMYRLSRPTISSASSTESGKITVKWGKNDKATGYQLRYVKGTTEKTVTVTSKTTVSKVLSSLTKGATYKISVRSYKTVDGTKYYSAWSAAKSVKVK